MSELTVAINIDQLAVAIAAALPEHAKLPALLSLQTVAESLDCSTEHVRSLVGAGHLLAVDIAEDPSKRSALRITRDSLTAFTDRRMVG